MDNFKTKVIFRKLKDNGDVIALFPEELGSWSGNMLSYMRVGQHDAADYDHLLPITKPATENDYMPLYEELTSIGYNLDVCKRESATMRQVRLNKWHEYNGKAGSEQ